jgi:hypothetical protein
VIGLRWVRGDRWLTNARNRRESINMRNKPALEYLKTEAYVDQIPRFKATLEEIGKTQGWELADIQKRFSNKMWDYLIYSA